ncbi:MAG: TolC family protein, partial [Muribaculaceae bacterium]|nr:TolC family protein [Muribaculaceae bacterium]
MKRIILSALLAAACAEAPAQMMTLDECIAYAIENNLTVRQREIDRQSAEQQLTSAKDAVLPTISGSASQSWN